MCSLFAELSSAPILVFPDWDAVAAGSCPFRIYCDARVAGFGATLEQEQLDGTVHPIVEIRRATISTISAMGVPLASKLAVMP